MAEARILIVDDHPLFREALRLALSTAKPWLEISEADSLNALTRRLADDDSCDLVLLDLRMPGVQGLSGLIYLRSRYPGIPVVVVSASEEAGVVQKTLDLGASGFIPKSGPARSPHMMALRGFAEITGGSLIEVESPQRIEGAFAQIVTAMKNRYILRYAPETEPTPGWHKLDLQLKSGGKVRGRNGYWVEKR